MNLVNPLPRAYRAAQPDISGGRPDHHSKLAVNKFPRVRLRVPDGKAAAVCQTEAGASTGTGCECWQFSPSLELGRGFTCAGGKAQVQLRGLLPSVAPRAVVGHGAADRFGCCIHLELAVIELCVGQPVPTSEHCLG
jgi:hypothetical protein